MILREKVIFQFNKNYCLFNDFTYVYLFGSALFSKRETNDIDILVIYKKYSKEIRDEVINIENMFYFNFKIPIDITVLSEDEEKQVCFLKRLKSNYLKIK
mgnify:CR=1 FL=1